MGAVAPPLSLVFRVGGLNRIFLSIVTAYTQEIEHPKTLQRTIVLSVKLDRVT